jgi:periplasmic divalent cation tolerance protein
MDQPAPVIVLTTWPAASDAAALANTLVAERLAACVNLLPEMDSVYERLAACVNLLPEMDSVYAWRGGVERDRERQVIIKTTTARLDALERRLAELHPYEVPEFLVMPVAGGSAAYLQWLRGSTETAPGPPQS